MLVQSRVMGEDPVKNFGSNNRFVTHLNG